MSTRIAKHIRSNVLGLVAIFIALGGTAYATHPGGADTISSGDIINDNVNSADVRNDTLTNGGLQAVDLRSDSVGSSEVANDSLDATDLNASSVTSSELALGAIPSDGINFGDGSTKLAAGSVGESELEVDSVTSSELRTNSVGQDEIRLGAIGNGEIQGSAITGFKIADGTLDARDVGLTSGRVSLDFGNQFPHTCDLRSVDTAAASVQGDTILVTPTNFPVDFIVYGVPGVGDDIYVMVCNPTDFDFDPGPRDFAYVVFDN
jgi:hypothetical protein